MNETEEKLLENKVSYQALGIFVVVIIAIFGWVIASVLKTEALAQEALSRVSVVEGDIKGMRGDLGSIKSNTDKLLDMHLKGILR